MKYERSTSSRRAVIKTKLIYDIILLWSVNCRKSDKKIRHISQRDQSFQKGTIFALGKKIKQGYNCHHTTSTAGQYFPPGADL